MNGALALLITGVITMAGFRFYVRMHNEVLTQDEISEMQHNSRASLEEMVRTLRMAGFKTGGHAPYLINGDSIYVFFSGTQPIDTVLYFLADYDAGEQDSLRQKFSPRYRLMRKFNSDNASTYADNIKSLSFTEIDASTIRIDLDVQTESTDEAFADNHGIRVYDASERVNLRNLKL